MEYVRTKDYYVGEYCPNPDIEKARNQVIILKVPTQFEKAYDHFLKGEFSQMYSKEEAQDMFYKPTQKLTYEVLTRTGTESFLIFAGKVKAIFYAKEDFRKEDVRSLKPAEWDLPIINREEILNFTEKERIYFNEKLDKIWKMED